MLIGFLFSCLQAEIFLLGYVPGRAIHVCLLKKTVRTETDVSENYRVFRAQADCTFILPPELPAKELCHLPRKMPPRGTTY
jgi:hypothetical protein